MTTYQPLRTSVFVTVYVATVMLSCSVSSMIPDTPEHIAEARRNFRQAIATAQSPDRRTVLIYEWRLFEHSARFGTTKGLVTSQNGIDEFEALVLAKVYLSRHIGLCTHISLPTLQEDVWSVPIAVGLEATPEKPIRIHRLTGVVSCEGYSAVESASTLLRALDQAPRL